MGILMDNKKLGSRAVKVLVPGHGNGSPFMGQSRPYQNYSGQIHPLWYAPGAVTGIIRGTPLDPIPLHDPVKGKAVIKTRCREIDKMVDRQGSLLYKKLKNHAPPIPY